ncbi:prepilin-type N-terminal cleavage/methylation domain-containing protein [Elusimicrobium simillimum]|uniref:type IV pilin protein n=1 Tax=Elusimicrobium simillimum TaxID=3143438 RepID=UPI003C6EB044
MKKGFTLIELLVVVLIIGILAAIALPQYQKAVAKARVAEAMIVLRNLVDAQERYYLEHDEYAGNIDDLDITIPDGRQWQNMTAEQKAKVYHYICSNQACEANTDAVSFPQLEYYLPRGSNTGWQGRRWCKANTENSAAMSVCKSYSERVDWTDGGRGITYFIMK